MDNQYTAGQYESNNFLNIWSIPNLTSNDSENLNITRELFKNNQSILTTQNETGQVNLFSKQSSSSLLLDEVFEILDNFIKNQNENYNPQIFPDKCSLEKLPSTYDNQEFYNRFPQCETIGVTSAESFEIFNNNSTKKFYTITDSDSSEYSSNSPSPKNIRNESVTKSCFSVNSDCHFEKRISADDVRIKAGRKIRRRRTVFTNSQVETLNMAFLRSHYLKTDTLDQLKQSLKLPEDIIKVWFCNKRRILKKQNKKHSNSNLNLQKPISTNSNDRSKNFVESPKNYVYDQNSNQIESLVESPKNYVQNLNRNREDPQPDCTINSLSAYVKQNSLEKSYCTYPVELDESNVIYVAPIPITTYFNPGSL